jgi:hypothetical protein
MAMYINGKRVASNEGYQEITQAEYDALSDTDKMNGHIYLITDSNLNDDYVQLIRLQSLIGDETQLSGYADGTLAGILVDLYNRLGGFSFDLTSDNTLTATYSDEKSTAVVRALSETASDAEKVEHMLSLIGDEDTLAETGFSTIAAAIVELYNRLDGTSYSYNSDTNTAEVTVQS